VATILLERPKIDRPKRRDLTPKLRYPCAMTVCIAASCKEQGKPRIVLCSDTRLDYGDLGSTNMAVKCDVLGHGWVVQMAGDWSSVRSLCSILKDRVQALTRLDSSEAARESQKAISQFLKSPLFDLDKDSQLLLSGFDGDIPCILEVSIMQGKSKVELKDSFGTIGWGGGVATTLLTLREHNAGMPLSYVAYLTYEAKRCAEKTGFVGRFTTLMTHAPNVKDIKDRAYLRIMNNLGEAHLEAVYAALWKVPFATIPDLTPDFFDDLKGKQSPQ